MKSCLDGRKPSFVVEKVKGMLQRNDDCPCGSGRKYKKCCLSRVEKANRIIKSGSRAGYIYHHRAENPCHPGFYVRPVNGRRGNLSQPSPDRQGV
ncbi:MAG: SEC-C metal-binding domain-containing protein [Moorella sp. (in: firmicutes)]